MCKETVLHSGWAVANEVPGFSPSARSAPAEEKHQATVRCAAARARLLPALSQNEDTNRSSVLKKARLVQRTERPTHVDPAGALHNVAAATQSADTEREEPEKAG